MRTQRLVDGKVVAGTGVAVLDAGIDLVLVGREQVVGDVQPHVQVEWRCNTTVGLVAQGCVAMHKVNRFVDNVH